MPLPSSFGEAVHARLTHLDEEGIAYNVLRDGQRLGVKSHTRHHLVLESPAGSVVSDVFINLALTEAVEIID